MDKSIKILEKVMDICTYRQKILASNIANADTPNYKAKDINFQEELKKQQKAIMQSIKLLKHRQQCQTETEILLT